jgi:antitoxin PrlF
MAHTSTVSVKGQVTIPKEVRECLHLNAGDKVVFVQESGNMVIKKAALVVLERRIKGV